MFGLGRVRAGSGERREESQVLMQIRTCACKGRTRPEWQQGMTDLAIGAAREGSGALGDAAMESLHRSVGKPLLLPQGLGMKC